MKLAPSKSPTKFQPPEIKLDEKGRPNVKSVLKEAERSPYNSPTRSPIINPNKYALTPRMVTPPATPPRTGSIPQQRRLPSAPAKSPANSQDTTLARAKRESRRKLESDSFEEIETIPLPSPPSSNRSIVPSSKVLQKDQERLLLGNREKVNNELATAEQIQAGYVVYKTSGGVYQVPDYSLKTPLEIEHERIHLIETIKDMNTKFNKYHLHFEQPKEGEDISTTHIRVQRYRRQIKKRTGTNMWWIVLVAIFAAAEKFLCWMDYKADGLMMLQLSQYKLYQSQMEELGEGSGFGEEWPAWVQTAITGVFGCVLFVGMTTYGPKGSAKYAGAVIKKFSSIITGSDTIAVDEKGNPLPEEEDLFDKASKFFDKFEGKSLNDITDIFSLFMNGFGGGGSDEKKKPKEKKEKLSREEKKRIKEERLRKARGEDDD